jgi:hypothetical protein
VRIFWRPEWRLAEQLRPIDQRPGVCARPCHPAAVSASLIQYDAFACKSDLHIAAFAHHVTIAWVRGAAPKALRPRNSNVVGGPRELIRLQLCLYEGAAPGLVDWLTPALNQTNRQTKNKHPTKTNTPGASKTLPSGCCFGIHDTRLRHASANRIFMLQPSATRTLCGRSPGLRRRPCSAHRVYGWPGCGS